MTRTPLASSNDMLLPYVASLELEVDRLRKQGAFVLYEMRSTLKQVAALCASAKDSHDTPVLGEISHSVEQLVVALHDLQDPPGYHPAHDQVIAIAVRPLIEKVFRWQQRLADCPEMDLRLDLQQEYVEWFPTRLRHILENLVAHAVKHQGPERDESWVSLSLRHTDSGYEFRLRHDGISISAGERAGLFELFYRAAPARAAGLGVGLAVVKLLVEQSGGVLTLDPGEGEGAAIVAILPRYDVDDFLI